MTVQGDQNMACGFLDWGSFPHLDRRQALISSAALLASTGCSGFTAHAGGNGNIPVRQLGAITANSLLDMQQFGKWLGRVQDHDLIYFNQGSWEALEQSVPYIVALGAGIVAQSRRIHWSIPGGGPAPYGEIASGQRDLLFERIGQSIAEVYGASRQRICVRLFWEFNMPEQTLAARGAGGVWQPSLYVMAYRRVASILRKISDRFYFDWCPNIGLGGVAPERCYPGDEFVDVVSVDVYYCQQYDRQNHRDNGKAIFDYRRSQPFGLDWLSAFASRHGKLIGISEWGVDDEDATAFMEHMCQWIIGLGDALSHHNYWDRSDGGVASRISTGQLPAISAIYREYFGQ